MASWQVPSHSEHKATLGMTDPLSQERMLQLVDDAQKETDQNKVAAIWREILEGVHAQSIFFPLWGTRNPAVINRRLYGFTPASTAFSYDLNSIRVGQGSTEVTVAPGFGERLFASAGPIHPHQYGPNNMNMQAWVYEGLVGYGQDGEVSPMLATSWEKEPADAGGEIYTFTLREGVTFHDGSAFNCSVAKLNFDHVLQDKVKTRHGWMNSVDAMESWTCNDAGQFVIETNAVYTPLLQELGYIRPYTFASAETFANGLGSDPVTENACGGFSGKHEAIEDTVTCAGLLAPVGTGPFKFVSRAPKNGDETIDAEVVFEGFQGYWGPKSDITVLRVVNYETTDDVEAALLSDELDMALGLGPLTAQQVFKFKSEHSDRFDVRHTDVLQHALVVFNTAQAPTNDIRVRQAIIHAIDKNTFIEQEFSNLEQPVGQLLPYSAPYCNVDLNPKWSYDPAKAELLNCPVKESSSSDLSTGAIAGVSVACAAAAALLVAVCYLVSKEKSGTPVFTPEKSQAGTSA
jgi:ABC-type transport system substrate-binding protein